MSNIRPALHFSFKLYLRLFIWKVRAIFSIKVSKLCQHKKTHFFKVQAWWLSICFTLQFCKKQIVSKYIPIRTIQTIRIRTIRIKKKKKKNEILCDVMLAIPPYIYILCIFLYSFFIANKSQVKPWKPLSFLANANQCELLTVKNIYISWKYGVLAWVRYY